MQMTFSTDHEKNQALLESTRQRVKELEDRMGYKSQGLGEEGGFKYELQHGLTRRKTPRRVS